MLRRSIMSLGVGLVCANILLLLAAPPARAQATPAPTTGGAMKAEAEPGHTASTATHGGEAEVKQNPMELQPTLAIWTVAVFLLLLFLLQRFAWKPLSEALHQREEHLEHTLLQTEKARNESEQLLAEHRRLMAQADERVRAIFDKAQKDAQASGEEIVRAARSEADAARERAQRDIATARDQALSEIWSQAADLAVSVAGRVLSKQLTADEHRHLLDLAMQELPAAPVGSNGHGGGAR